MRRVLVTGATGGLGRILVPALLAAGYRVRATGRDLLAGSTLADLGAEFAAADLCDPSNAVGLTKGVDVVVHAAALSSPWGAPATFKAVNLGATANLLAAAQSAGCDGFIYLSTPSIYAEPRDRLGLTEQSPLAQQFANDYVCTKYAAEQAVLAANAPGFFTSALRPRAIVGPYDRTLLPRLVRVARRGCFPVFRGGRAMIDVTDARDVAQAVIAADRRAEVAAGRAYNISGGAPITVGYLLDEAFLALHLAPRRVAVAYPLALAAIVGLEALCTHLPGRPEPPATVYSLGALAFSQTFDLTAARRDLGWTPRYSPQEAIALAAGGRDATV